MNDILKRMLEILIRHESMRENAELDVSEPPIKNDQVFVMWYNLALIIVSDAHTTVPHEEKPTRPPLNTCSCTSPLSKLPR